MDSTALQTYQTQQVMTASPAKLVAMSYDKAIALLNEAAEAVENGDIQGRCNANRKAVEILAHLWGSLDLERGGEIAANLNKLYAFMISRLGEVDMKNDAGAAREVIGLLDPLRNSWHELAAQNPTADRPAAQQAATEAAPSDPGPETAASLTLSA